MFRIIVINSVYGNDTAIETIVQMPSFLRCSLRGLCASSECPYEALESLSRRLASPVDDYLNHGH